MRRECETVLVKLVSTPILPSRHYRIRLRAMTTYCIRPVLCKQLVTSATSESNLLRLCKIGCLPETRHKPNFREILFAHNLLSIYPIVLMCCTQHDNDTVVLFAKCQNESTFKINAMVQRDFARFEYKMNFEGCPTSYFTDPTAVFRNFIFIIIAMDFLLDT